MENKLSIIIVNYNSTIHLNRLIESLHFIDQITTEIIVIDNNSKDFINFKKNNKKIHIIKNKQNLGFAKAVNQGIKKSTNQYIFLLNPDTIIVDKSIIKTFNLLKDDEKIGIIGGKIQKMNDQTFQYTANQKPNFLTALFEFTNLKKIFPNNKYSKNFWVESSKKIINPTKVDALCGAFLIFRKFDRQKNINLLDEKYFLYLEDLDFCLTMRNKKYQIILDPRSKIKHISGASSNSKYNIVLKYWYKSRKIFFKKYSSSVEYIILSIIFSIEEKLLQIYHSLKNEPNE